MSLDFRIDGDEAKHTCSQKKESRVKDIRIHFAVMLIE